MEPLKKKPRLDGALARWSFQSTCALPSVLEGKQKSGPSGAEKRAAAAALAPAKKWFRLISAPNNDPDEEPIQFYLADMQCLLKYVAQKCPSFETFLRGLGPDGLHAIISHDETTGVNVLCTEQRLKVNLFYATFTALQGIHESPRAWLPLGAVSHEQASAVRGGFSKIHALFIEEWCRQGLERGVEILPNLQVKIDIQAFVADMEAQRQALCAKGSAGLKPCAFCQNCVAKSSQAVHAGFHSICEPAIERFQQHLQEDLQAYMAAALNALPNMTLKDQDLLEKCLGYRLTGDGMWASAACCDALPLGKYVNDSMHIFFANGIASTEVNLLVAAVWKETKQSTSDIRKAVIEMAWERPGMRKRSGESKFWISRLFQASLFVGAMYKGSAKQTVALLAILRWLAESVWAYVPALQPAVDSFLKLCKCTDAVRTIAITKDYTALIALQKEHLTSFSVAWPTHERPKHHHALHLARQYSMTQCTPTCWGTEAKHKDYKQVFAKLLQHRLSQKDGGSGFSWSLLPRLLMRHCEFLNMNPLSSTGFQLTKEFSAEEICSSTGLDNCRVAPRCSIGMLELQERDILLHGAKKSAALHINFFIVKDQQLYIHVSLYNLIQASAALKRFRLTDTRTVVKWSNLLLPSVPSWWRHVGQFDLQCMP